MNRYLLDKLDGMTTSDLYDAVYKDSLTGVYNRRAFESFDKPKAVALVDLDSLKYINDNHHLHHRAGDAMIQLLSSTLVQTFNPNRVFRAGETGDEFIITSPSIDHLGTSLYQLSSYNPYFSYGLGRTLDEADGNLYLNKVYREQNGIRATRGEKPRWFEEISKWTWQY